MGRLAAATLAAALILAGCSNDGTDAQQSASRSAPTAAPIPAPTPSLTRSAQPGPTGAGSPTGTPTGSGPSAPDTTPQGPPPTSGPVRLERWFDRALSGGGLRLGAQRERTASYRSYDVSYRGQDLRISGVINVPTGRGPFPAVVLAHGYIDPKVYVRGQGMPRERRSLASAGYIALHVDYRNHAESDDDPALQRTARLGYSVDVLNAVNALRATDEVPVDDDRIALMGRSMGGGVVYRALEMAPGLVDAGIVFAAVSSDEADNYAQFAGPSPYWDYVEERWGSPRDNPDFWDAISADQHFGRVTQPVLMHHGTEDTTCPPRWARHTARAMERAGVDVTLKWYEGQGHTFDSGYDRAMERSVAFLERHLQ
jgi:dipeptidyl aminopeptidase/acylaminoacyl peptidase